jgi:hypothetical protein
MVEQCLHSSICPYGIVPPLKTEEFNIEDAFPTCICRLVSGNQLEAKSRFSLLSGTCGFVDVRREEVSCCWASPAQSFSGPRENTFLSHSHITTDGQSASLSCCQEPVWGPWAFFIFLITFRQLRGTLFEEKRGL